MSFKTLYGTIRIANYLQGDSPERSHWCLGKVIANFETSIRQLR
ncbi:MAG: hypothetical protein AB8F26_10740 [Phycisphaerales bacterium]